MFPNSHEAADGLETRVLSGASDELRKRIADFRSGGNDSEMDSRLLQDTASFLALAGAIR